MTHQPTSEPSPISEDAAEHLVDAYDGAGQQEPEAQAAGMMTDEFLLRPYQRTDGEPGNAEADALLAEIERRNLGL